MNVDIATKDDLNKLRDEIITEIRSSKVQELDGKRYVDSRFVEGLLDISSGKLQQLRDDKELPFHKIGKGKLIRYDYDDLIKYLDETKKTRKDSEK